jgi:hypothetical protein
MYRPKVTEEQGEFWQNDVELNPRVFLLKIIMVRANTSVGDKGCETVSQWAAGRRSSGRHNRLGPRETSDARRYSLADVTR